MARCYLSAATILIVALTASVKGAAQQPISMQVKRNFLKTDLPELPGNQQINTLHWLGTNYWFSDPERSIKLLTRAIEIGDSKTPLNILHADLGIANTLAGHYGAGQRELQTGLELTLLHDSVSLLLSHYYQGVFYSTVGEYKKAIEEHYAALKLAEELNDEFLQMRVAVFIALTFCEAKEYQNAAHYDTIGFQLAEKLGDRMTYAMAMTTLAQALKDMRRVVEAKAAANRVIKRFEKDGEPYLFLGTNYFTVSLLHAENYDSSVYYNEKAVQTFRKTGAKIGLAWAIFHASRLQMAAGNLKKAESLSFESLTIQNSLERADQLKKLLFLNMIKIFVREGNIKQANAFEQKYVKLTDSLQKRKLEEAVVEMKARYETEQKVQENALLRKEAEVNESGLQRRNYALLSGAWGLLLLVVIGIALYIRYQRKLQLSKILESENQSLKVAKLSAQLNQLKDQVNPHFLFNSLASVQAMIEERDPNTGLYLESLAEIYRYILQSHTSDLVSLEQELSVAKAYLFMLETRYERGLQTNIDISESILDKKLPPFSLQLLIENAVKHNLATSSKPLKIDLFEKDSMIFVRNNFQPKRSRVESNHVGLTNLRKRFTLLGNSDINIEQGDDFFIVSLPLF